MNKDINRFFNTPVVTAAELFSAGWCNLHCKYCYIPKTDFLQPIHKSIIEAIQNGQYILDLKEMFGENLTSISHWGTEPTLTTKYFKKFYKDASKMFPKLDQIKLSSNFMTNPNNLLKFVTDIVPKGKSYNIDIQVSLDGPPFITDKNRLGGSCEKIVENCIYFTTEINKLDLNHNITMHLKPTFGKDDIMIMSEYQNTLSYYKFFDKFMTSWIESNKNNNVQISTNCDPTIVFPGTYTKEDGINFYSLILNQLDLKNKKWKTIKPESSYYYKFKEKISFFKEFYSKQHMFTCSAGDTCFGVGDIPGTLHLCHQSFYTDHKEYNEAAETYGLSSETLKAIKNGGVNNLLKTYIYNKSEEEIKLLKILYNNRAYNDFAKHKIAILTSLTFELAEVEQINSCYKDPKLAKIFSELISLFNCTAESISITGSSMILASSFLKLFGNGAFEKIFKRIVKEME